MKALILAADRFEDLDLFVPWFRLRETGCQVTVASPAGKAIVGLHGYAIEADMPIVEVNPGEYELLVIPGGLSPELLRLREEAVDVARTFSDEGQRIAAIGHGPQLLLSAGAISGRSVTCSPGIRDDMRAAGATYRDEPCVIDGPLLTCRGTDDLPEFNRLIAEFVDVSLGR